MIRSIPQRAQRSWIRRNWYRVCIGCGATLLAYGIGLATGQHHAKPEVRVTEKIVYRDWKVPVPTMPQECYELVAKTDLLAFEYLAVGKAFQKLATLTDQGKFAEADKPAKDIMKINKRIPQRQKVYVAAAEKCENAK